MMRERGEDGLARVPCDEPFEDAGAVGAKEVREDAPDTGPSGVEDLVDAVARACALAHELTAHARDFAQGAEPGRGNEARRTQSELADAGKPQAVGDVGLAAPELLDVLGVDELDLDARMFERLVGRVSRRARDRSSYPDSSGVYGNWCSTARKPQRAAASNQSRKGRSVNR